MTGSNALASLPLLGGGDDFPEHKEKPETEGDDNRVGEISDSSSSSSDSDSDSDNETKKTNGHVTNGTVIGSPKLPVAQAHILSEDLCLSESGSDSD